MKNIPTAQEILFSILSNTKNDDVIEYLEEHPEEIANYVVDIIEFAKLHVEQALNKASNIPLPVNYSLNSKANDAMDKVIRQSILSAYPLELIK